MGVLVFLTPLVTTYTVVTITTPPPPDVIVALSTASGSTGIPGLLGGPGPSMLWPVGLPSQLAVMLATPVGSTTFIASSEWKVATYLWNVRVLVPGVSWHVVFFGIAYDSSSKVSRTAWAPLVPIFSGT